MPVPRCSAARRAGAGALHPNALARCTQRRRLGRHAQLGTLRGWGGRSLACLPWVASACALRFAAGLGVFETWLSPCMRSASWLVLNLPLHDVLGPRDVSRAPLPSSRHEPLSVCVASARLLA